MQNKKNLEKLENLAKYVRRLIITSTTAAGSGHPTSSLSAADLMSVLMFGGYFHFIFDTPQYPNNDRLIFSKGHAAPLFYALWAVAGAIDVDELKTLRQFNSRLEGHPTMEFPFTEAATGSLGQGLSLGVGMAISAKLDRLPYKTYVLLGDSEMSEGSVWEAIQLAVYYKLNNLIGVIDVNRLGQRGETMYGHNIGAYQKRISAFGWETIAIDGHNIEEIDKAFDKAAQSSETPVMIIAKTMKGKGVSFLENKENMHGKALTQEQMQDALKELGEIKGDLKGEIPHPQEFDMNALKPQKPKSPFYEKGDAVATRKAYGNALARLSKAIPQMIVLDAEVSNSTFAEKFKEVAPDRFFEMFIAEQNMVGVAQGLARRGKKVFCSSFAAFLMRAADQIRMGQYSRSPVVYVGSHSGVSIGEDGASQMGLEDIAFFRTLLNCAVVYPSDAFSTERLVEAAAEYTGAVYIRTTRKDTPLLYEQADTFYIGGSRVLKSSDQDVVTIVAAGITLHEALSAYEQLVQEDIFVRVIDAYSIKPIDEQTLKTAAIKTGFVITVEDHFAQGGLGEAVLSALAKEGKTSVHIMAVTKMPKSGKPEELLDYEEISKRAIIKKVKELISY